MILKYIYIISNTEPFDNFSKGWVSLCAYSCLSSRLTEYLSARPAYLSNYLCISLPVVRFETYPLCMLSLPFWSVRSPKVVRIPMSSPSSFCSYPDRIPTRWPIYGHNDTCVYVLCLRSKIKCSLHNIINSISQITFQQQTEIISFQNIFYLFALSDIFLWYLCD